MHKNWNKKGRLEGIQLGEAKGRQEGEASLKIARAMLTSGLDAVMQMTALTTDGLQNVKAAPY